jgi:hypothetical protein
MRVELQLSSYETYLKLRAMLGLQQMTMGGEGVRNSFREA